MNVTLGGDGEVILSVRPSLLRRGVSLIALGTVALFLIYAGLSGDVQGFVWRALLVVFGGLILALAERFYRATNVALELTRDELRDSTGRRLFRLKEIVRVDRGAFSMKPSNGLSILLNTKGDFAWEPGLWWRMGKRLGIGGATAPSQARAIADAIALLEAERKGDKDIPQSLV